MYTSHWLSKEFEQQRAVLRIIPFSGFHTGKHIGKEFKSVLKDYHLSKKKIISCSARFCSKYGNRTKQFWFSCLILLYSYVTAKVDMNKLKRKKKQSHPEFAETFAVYSLLEKGKKK